ncbi:MAG TPA: phenylalanine--tRNA ligase subunit beta [Lacibacter sp.]|nr:phenylalanine--tRNA ligase subunit beta [Lacibacter sp.]HMO87884.1 phenylalanine--tRNA ligase subunit beta [Lacibacter sp.]HMP86376.1 phenylalanine--tRNA ligase subunit beta [Lacibacter sp.]
MTISYNWLLEYLPEPVDPHRLSRILTSIGLEVESMEPYEEVKGGLNGLLIGEILTCEKHPDADKLKCTTVNVGDGVPLSIVCGAPNAAAGQKVVVAPIGTTLYPVNGEPMTMKKAKIRGMESHGMICAEDEIGLGASHDGILVLPNDAKPGTPAAEYFRLQTDWVYEIGLTPNRMDAMSHMGVARDVIAYLNFHDKKNYNLKSPLNQPFKPDSQALPIQVLIEDDQACQRYAGVSIKGVTVQESPAWLQQRLKSIGLRPINNIVDITNFILHETGQPLHAFDADAITGGTVVVKTLPKGTPFVTLDEKERLLDTDDLMICNREGAMCIGGVFGGLHSGVTATTQNIFLESAWFHPSSIRKTSFRHGLRTDAALRFEKGVDISATVAVLKRAALLIRELAGGEIASEVVDVYPHPRDKTSIALKFHYLKKISGKNYHPDNVKKILLALGFEIVKESIDELWVAAPLSKPDMEHPADLAEEIMRIDGLDNVEIPSSITISPSVETNAKAFALKETVANYLAGNGFREILTNSIANSSWYGEEVLAGGVQMLNSLSAGLNLMRPSMLETGLECVAFNLNRKNNSLRLFEFGKTYRTKAVGDYEETDHLTLYATGPLPATWKLKDGIADFFYLKGMLEGLLRLLHVEGALAINSNAEGLTYTHKNKTVARLYQVAPSSLKQFDIRQDVVVADCNWNLLLELAAKTEIKYREIPRFPAVERDLAVVVGSSVSYAQVESAVQQLRLKKLQQVSLFDVFESEKIGAGRKSLALSFVFQDPEKTLTDEETDRMMTQIMERLEQELGAAIRK